MKSRDKMLNAAEDLFFELGYAAASTKEIAKKAGVNELTLFRNFKNKKNLLDEVVTRGMEALDFYSQDFFADKISYNFQKDLLFINESYQIVLQKNKKIVSLIFDRNMKEFDDFFCMFPQQFKERLVTYLARMERAGKIIKTDFDKVAEHFISVNMGYFLITNRFDDQINKMSYTQFIEENVNFYSKILEKR